MEALFNRLSAFLRVESLVHQLIPFLTLPRFGFHLLRRAFVNVTTSRRSTSTGFSSLIIFLIIRSTNTAVFLTQLQPQLKYHVHSLQQLSTGHLSIDYLLVFRPIFYHSPPTSSLIFSIASLSFISFNDRN